MDGMGWGNSDVYALHNAASPYSEYIRLRVTDRTVSDRPAADSDRPWRSTDRLVSASGKAPSYTVHRAVPFALARPHVHKGKGAGREGTERERSSRAASRCTGNGPRLRPPRVPGRPRVRPAAAPHPAPRAACAALEATGLVELATCRGGGLRGKRSRCTQLGGSVATTRRASDAIWAVGYQAPGATEQAGRRAQTPARYLMCWGNTQCTASGAHISAALPRQPQLSTATTHIEHDRAYPPPSLTADLFTALYHGASLSKQSDNSPRIWDRVRTLVFRSRFLGLFLSKGGRKVDCSAL